MWRGDHLGAKEEGFEKFLSPALEKQYAFAKIGG